MVIFLDRAGELKDHMQAVTIFTTTWCGHCRRLKRQFDEAGISYSEVDIEADPSRAADIEDASGGFRTVPTVEVGERLLVNPTLAHVKEALSV